MISKVSKIMNLKNVISGLNYIRISQEIPILRNRKKTTQVYCSIKLTINYI